MKTKRLDLKLVCVICVLFSMFQLPVKASNYEYIEIKGTYLQQEAKEHLRLLNNVRKNAGVSQLKMDADLMKAAELRAAEISVYFGTTHYRPNGLYSTTVHSKAWAENICRNTLAEGSIQMFKNSQAHYNVMTTAGFSSVGIACFEDERGYVYWVQLFGGSNIKEQTSYKKRS